LANGYPVSAVAGRRDLMKLMEEVFFSFTFGGEALSLAAATATLDKLRRNNVCARLAVQGQKLIDGVKSRIATHRVGEFVSITGHPSWSFLLLKDVPGVSQWELKTLMLQEFFARGILSYGTHNLSFAHGDAEIERLLAVYDEVFPLLRAAAFDGRLGELLRCKPLEPLFKVR
jgi:glutamate-1-semialdehyde 2,1-aminomutase